MVRVRLAEGALRLAPSQDCSAWPNATSCPVPAWESAGLEEPAEVAIVWSADYAAARLGVGCGDLPGWLVRSGVPLRCQWEQAGVGGQRHGCHGEVHDHQRRRSGPAPAAQSERDVWGEGGR